MSSEPKPLLSRVTRQAAGTRRIAQLATEPTFRDAQLWLVRERGWINQLHRDLCRVPAPTFFESERAEWFRRRLTEFGWNAELDRAGNVVATIGSQVSEAGAPPSLVVSAHLDTVFAPARPEEISMAPDGRLTGPGVSDNGSGLAALLVLARLFGEDGRLEELASQVMLVANVGEEGEGNLSGMRYLCKNTLNKNAAANLTGGKDALGKGGPGQQTTRPEPATTPEGQLAAFVVLDGPSTDHITSQALASRRFEIAFSGPGGHSWNDYGRPNPVHATGDLVSHFVQTAEELIASDRNGRCAFNFGVIEGGTSINAIPSSARAKLDLRSENPGMLDELANLLSTSVERSLERVNRAGRDARLSAKIRELGSRPGGRLPETAPLLASIQAVDAYLNIRSRLDCASTDANVPLSMGLPAISIGAGGQGGGAHTSAEWYQPEGREVGIHRILLLLADVHAFLTHPSVVQSSSEG